MIKAGLVSQKRGGGFEQGYPNQKYPKGRDEFIRPYVNNSDPTILRKSEYSDPMAYKAVTPSPVQYNDLFRKKPTPDERLYILKQIQQGLDKVQKGILGKIPGGPVVAVPSATAPSATQPTDEVGQTIGAPPAGPPGGGGGILVDDTPDMGVASPVSSKGAEFTGGGDGAEVPFDSTQQDGTDEIQNAQYKAELQAVQVVTPATVDPVREDVVTGDRSIIAKDNFIDSSSESSGGQTEKAQEKIDISKAPPTPSWWDGSARKFKEYFFRQKPDKKREIVANEMAMIGPQPEMTLPPTTAKRPREKLRI